MLAMDSKKMLQPNAQLKTGENAPLQEKLNHDAWDVWGFGMVED